MKKNSNSKGDEPAPVVTIPGSPIGAAGAEAPTVEEPEYTGPIRTAGERAFYC